MHVSMHQSPICLFLLSWSLLQLKAEFTNGVRSLDAFVKTLSHCVVLLVGNSLIMIITLIITLDILGHGSNFFTHYGIRHFGIRHCGNNSFSLSVHTLMPFRNILSRDKILLSVDEWTLKSG